MAENLAWIEWQAKERPRQALNEAERARLLREAKGRRNVRRRQPWARAILSGLLKFLALLRLHQN